MTAKTTDFSGLLYYNPAGPGFNAVPQVTIHCPDNMDEGDTITVELVTWGIPDGTVLYHVFPLFGTNLTSDRFNVSPHPVVENNRASFTVEVSADNTTSVDGQSFDIVIKKTLTGPALATKYGVNVNDTSQGAPTGNDFAFFGDQNQWVINGGFNAGSIFSDPAPTNPAYTYPDNSYTGKTYNFDGTTWMIGANLAVGGAWQSNTITIDFWFYPTANSVQLLTELGQQYFVALGYPGYHTTLLEINSAGNVDARFWQNTAPGQVITSTNAVNLNHWNHVYFTEDGNGAHVFELNGVAATGTPTYTRYNPLITSNTNIHFAIGGSESQNMGTTGGFQGKIGYLNIHDYVVASTYAGTVNRFRPSSQFYTHHFNTEGPPGVTFATFIWPDVLQNVVGWTMTGPGVPAGTTVLSQSDNGIQTTMTVSQEISYHIADYTFIAP